MINFIKKYKVTIIFGVGILFSSLVVFSFFKEKTLEIGALRDERPKNIHSIKTPVTQEESNKVTLRKKTSESQDSQKNTPSLGAKDTDIRHKKNNPINQALEIYSKKLDNLVDNFSFSQMETRSILSMNPPEVQQALQQMNDEIRSEILEHNNLTHEEKTLLLWNKFIGTNWVGNDNAIEALFQDYLTALPAYEVSGEITNLLRHTKGDDDYTLNTRQKLLQIANAILNPTLVNVDELTSEDRDKYFTAQKIIKDYFREEIQEIGSSNSHELIEDTIFSAVDSYFQSKNPQDITDITTEIMRIAENKPDNANDYYQVLVHHVLTYPSVSQEALEVLLTSSVETKLQLDTAIISQISSAEYLNISVDIREKLLYHLHSFEPSPSDQYYKEMLEEKEKVIKILESS